MKGYNCVDFKEIKDYQGESQCRELDVNSLSLKYALPRNKRALLITELHLCGPV